jgi:hypothetical protein
MKLMLNCRQVTALVLQGLDRPLTRRERVALWLHMRICDPCPQFVKQTQLMRSAMGRWRVYADGGDEGSP